MLRNISMLLACVGFVFSAIVTQPAAAADKPFEPIFGFSQGKAIKGYDVVNYFTKGAPAKGSVNFQTDYAGTIWQFSSQENLDLFKADPVKYIPQYGGYCAYAASKDLVADGDPDNWRIVEGKLYLNTNFFAHQLWKGDIPANIKAANSNWPGLKTRITAVTPKSGNPAPSKPTEK